MRAIVGTSGWQYDDWRDALYGDRPKRLWLEHFATRLAAVEVNNTFYRLPEATTFSSWRQRTPDGFVFAVKASRFITHDRRLVDVSEAVTTLIERASSLGDKLGPILYQLPPSLRRDDDTLARFLDALPAYPKATMEFRHASWFDDAVFDALRGRDVALCVAHGRPGPSPVVTTASWGYFRLHGDEGYTQYSEQDNAAWADRVVESACDPVYVFFDNDTEGAAVRDAAAMTQGLRERGVRLLEPHVR